MNFEILINFQRKIRASLSFISNKSEKLNKSDLKLIDEVGNMANNLMNKNWKHYKKTHVIFSNEVLNIILKKKIKKFFKKIFYSENVFCTQSSFFNVLFK